MAFLADPAKEANGPLDKPHFRSASSDEKGSLDRSRSSSLGPFVSYRSRCFGRERDRRW
jgi:hypothetical protein